VGGPTRATIVECQSVHSAKRLAWGPIGVPFVECLRDTRQRLCHRHLRRHDDFSLPSADIKYSTKRSLPITSSLSLLCQVLHSAKFSPDSFRGFVECLLHSAKCSVPVVVVPPPDTCIHVLLPTRLMHAVLFVGHLFLITSGIKTRQHKLIFEKLIFLTTTTNLGTTVEPIEACALYIIKINILEV
jgi:hypothetical protein